MIDGNKQGRMLEYLADKLSGAHGKIEKKKKKVVDTEDSRYLVLDGNKVLFMIDREYSTNGLNYFYTRAKYNQKIEDIGFIIYKDGEKFFKSNAQNYYTKIQGQPIDDNMKKKINKMILFSPEEQFLYNDSLRYNPTPIKTLNTEIGRLQYYQPESKRLDEGVRIFTFEKVKHYTKNPYMEMPKYDFKDYIWIDNTFLDKGIKLEDGKIIPT